MANGLLSQIASGGANQPQDVAQGYLSGKQFQQESALRGLKGLQAQQGMQAKQQEMDIAASQAARERIQNLREDEVQELETGVRLMSPAVDYALNTGDFMGANQQLALARAKMEDMGYDLTEVPPTIAPENIDQWKMAEEQAVMTLDQRRKMMLESVKGPSTIIMAGDKKKYEKRAESLQTRADKVWESAQNANSSIRNLTMARNILKGGLETGVFQPAVMQVQRVFADAGMEIPGLNEVSDTETFNAMMSREIVSSLSEMDKPSDKDAQLVKDTVASIRNDERAAMVLVDSALAVAERKKEKQAFYEDYWKKNDGYEGVEQAWGEYVNKTPLIGKREDGKVAFWHDFKRTYPDLVPNPTLDEMIQAWNVFYGTK